MRTEQIYTDLHAFLCGGRPREPKNSWTPFFVRQRQTQRVAMLPKSSMLITQGEWWKRFHLVGRKDSFDGNVQILAPVDRIKIGKRNVNFFFLFTPTAEEKWRVNVHPSSTLWWWWSDVQSFAEHFAHQFNGEGDANGRKHCEKSALLSCCAAFAFANEEVFNSLWCRVKLFRSPIMLSLADPSQSKWWVKFLRSPRLAAGCPTCSFISCIGSLSDRWGFAIWTRFHNLALSSNWSRIAGG